MDALLGFRSRRALPSWEAAIETLLREAGDTAPAAASVIGIPAADRAACGSSR
jgi:hypothetical protein